jgi:hypothetical protein
MAAMTGLDRVVSHRRLILPQLSGSGVAAHEVIRLTGFKVIYGPARAGDIKCFIEAGMEATPEMRRVRFSLIDRLTLTPMEIAGALPFIAAGTLLILIAAGLGADGISLKAAWEGGSRAVLAFIGAFIAGGVLTPALLPWLPSRSFAIKGALVGLIWAIIMMPPTVLGAAATLLLLPSISGYLALNFTGASTFTSPSGVKKELRYAIPVFIGGAGLGVSLAIAQQLIRLSAGG